ncbi:XRE family transcriptional regulator [Paenibacillus silvae]|uniref:XRE family transcriptional regulator n=1 Tax=Paenibacillus silvae TaxID=1325358 RepID=UPI0020047225|nr:XRE family transcriptional regulator [Paenibacillus silvae]MCK6075376.1 XRE family transcriptional regulator [Paenibacillus silvae]MCK6149763.1 XRE family transcriptional regulator [Paenibacillus silvae]MCK6268061.1 XRE family transcriptional regulator [Paenibacillus silvae]
MANIWDSIQFNPSERPKYTRFELAKLVRDKRTSLGLTHSELSSQFGGNENLWESIEAASRAFNVRIYTAIGAFLGMSTKELTSKDVDNIEAISFRANETNEEINKAIQIANLIFDEMVMQEKISVN